ncbi:cytokine receptor-like isoform X2 [Sabethes cyaneus]|nr:cytokine receptor-like isoform X2 [Sabethes cyaneus]XP_053689164.1 cytokine receptor-like isoform X2 [Sabethes cyaneus]
MVLLGLQRAPIAAQIFFVQLCIYSVLGLGWISPQSPIYRLVNQSYNINCTLNRSDPETEKFTSSDLMFYIKDAPVSQDHVRIVNETTIQLNIHNSPVNVIQYICKLNNTKGVDMRSVFVGYKPYNVTNFKCRSENWQKMNCSFEQAYNPIPTKFDLSFRFDTSPVDFTCPLEGQFNNTWKCSIDLDSSYRQSHELYYFMLESSNIFGKNRQNFVVNNFNNVIPEAPSECTVSNITSNSAVLKWSISYKLQTFRRDFVFQVKMLSIYDNGAWKTIDVSQIKRTLTNYTLPIENLMYADVRYDVRIRMKTATAEDIEEMWSNYSSCLFNTLPKKPDNPPEVAVGGFEINAYNDIFVYWKEIPRSKHNSAIGFRYKITEIRKNGVPISNVTEGRNGSTMQQFKNMTDGNYTFIIRSSNSEGDSMQYSKLLIPSKIYRIPKPEIVKLLSDSGRYLLSWKATHEQILKVTSYTVFWCNSSSNSPNDCNGSINFVYVDADQLSYELSNVSSTLNFAVAANSKELSSGMVWASCTATQKNDIGKLKTIWIPSMQSTYIDLEWKLECGDSAIVEGYKIIYCPISSPRDQTCKTQEKSLNITGTTSHRISGLRPYVTYKIQVSMYSKSRIGPRSEPLFNTTLEAAPSPPRDLTYKDIRNVSVTLHWKAPLQINGGKMNYEVWYNHLHTKVYTDNYTDDITYVLRDLEPFTNYKIIVRAYTIGYSNNSNSVDITTDIGTPGMIHQPGSVDLNDTRISIVWQIPERRAGCIEYYELKIKTNMQNEETATISRVQSTRCRLTRSICQISAIESNHTDKYEFSVRAVNVILSPHAPNYTIWNKLSCDEKYTYYSDQEVPATYHHDLYSGHVECELNDDEVSFINWTKIDPYATLLHSQWSKPLAHWCNYGPGASLIIIVVQTIVACCGILILIFFSIISMQKMKHIKNIKVVLPDALNDIIIPAKPDALKKNTLRHENYSELLGKANNDNFSPFPFHHRKMEVPLRALEDSASLGSTEDNIDNDEIVNNIDLLSLSDDCKSESRFEIDNIMLSLQAPVNMKSDSKTYVIPKNIVNSAPADYIPAPVANKCMNGYVQAPRAKTVSSGYTQSLAGMSGVSYSKTSVATSTGAKNISGYVTHKQLSDYGHNNK